MEDVEQAQAEWGCVACASAGLGGACTIIGGLLMLRAGARKIPLTEEQKQRIAQRNAEADAQDARDR